MKKMLLLVLSLCVVASMAGAKVSGVVQFALDGDRLTANVRLAGVGKSDKIAYRFEWDAPDVSYTRKDGTKVPLFQDSIYPTAADLNKDGTPVVLYAGTRPWRCYCDDNGNGSHDADEPWDCWRTRAYRTVSCKMSNGKNVRGVGTWSVKVVRVDNGAVLATGSYEVQ